MERAGSSRRRGASTGTIQVALAVQTVRSCGSQTGRRCQPGPSANPKSVDGDPDLAQPRGVLGGERGAPDDAVRGRRDERGRPASEAQDAGQARPRRGHPGGQHEGDGEARAARDGRDRDLGCPPSTGLIVEPAPPRAARGRATGPWSGIRRDARAGPTERSRGRRSTGGSIHPARRSRDRGPVRSSRPPRWRSCRRPPGARARIAAAAVRSCRRGPNTPARPRSRPTTGRAR